MRSFEGDKNRVRASEMMGVDDIWSVSFEVAEEFLLFGVVVYAVNNAFAVGAPGR